MTATKWSALKSEMIRDKENNHGRRSQKKSKQDDAIFLPPFLLPLLNNKKGWLTVIASLSFSIAAPRGPATWLFRGQISCLRGARLIFLPLEYPLLSKVPHGWSWNREAETQWSTTMQSNRAHSYQGDMWWFQLSTTRGEKKKRARDCSGR